LKNPEEKELFLDEEEVVVLDASPIPKKLLRNSVAINGRDFWGRGAEIKFSPYAASGWYWQAKKSQRPIKISAQIMRAQFRRIRLEFAGSVLETFEHVGSLRWLGLEGVLIESTPWPPHFGSPLELWDWLKGALIPSGYIEWKELHDRSSSLGFSADGYTVINANRSFPDAEREARLQVNVFCDYPGLKPEQLVFELPRDDRALEKVFEAYVIGWPRWTYWASKLATFLGWPHHGRVMWIQEHGKATLNLALKHRLADILGVLAFAHPDGLIAARVFSNKGGHKSDINAVNVYKF